MQLQSPKCNYIWVNIITCNLMGPPPDPHRWYGSFEKPLGAGLSAGRVMPQFWSLLYTATERLTDISKQCLVFFQEDRSAWATSEDGRIINREEDHQDPLDLALDLSSMVRDHPAPWDRSLDHQQDHCFHLGRQRRKVSFTIWTCIISSICIYVLWLTLVCHISHLVYRQQNRLLWI